MYDVGLLSHPIQWLTKLSGCILIKQHRKQMFQTERGGGGGV
jgi:hypothetical protein